MANDKILIVDDHSTVRVGLRHIITTSFPEVCCGEASSSSEALRRLRSEKWDIVILDIKLPDISGLDLVNQIYSMYSDIKVLIFTMYTEAQFSIRAFKSGAHGYLTKNADDDKIIQAVDTLKNGRKYMTPELAELLSKELSFNKKDLKPLHENLSDREMQIFLKIASGKSMSTVADELSLTLSTIYTYRSRILKKLNAKTNAELIGYGHDNYFV